MALASLFTLLDDIASVLDDVALMTKVAAKKTAGVVGVECQPSNGRGGGARNPDCVGSCQRLAGEQGDFDSDCAAAGGVCAQMDYAFADDWRRVFVF